MARRRLNNLKFIRERERIAARKRPKNEKTKAREILNSAVRSGDIIKPTMCEACGKKKKLNGHHEDYSKPLEVEWLCNACHSEKHLIVDSRG